MPGDTGPGLDDILAGLENVSTFDNQLEFVILERRLADSANNAAPEINTVNLSTQIRLTRN